MPRIRDRQPTIETKIINLIRRNAPLLFGHPTTQFTTLTWYPVITLTWETQVPGHYILVPYGEN